MDTSCATESALSEERSVFLVAGVVFLLFEHLIGIYLEMWIHVYLTFFRFFWTMFLNLFSNEC